MKQQTKPDAHQLNLRLILEVPLELPHQKRIELASALADMLLQALSPTDGNAVGAEVGDESETHS